MAKYLIDANLPYYFSSWNNVDYLHVKDLDDSWSDDQIWEYAKREQLIIITKDADFSLKVLYKGAPPKVIHFKTGNMKIKDFHIIVSKVWELVENNINENSLINIYNDRIEFIS
jgi:predicted nuclease of predicted toxin-antitoxin system